MNREGKSVGGWECGPDSGGKLPLPQGTGCNCQRCYPPQAGNGTLPHWRGLRGGGREGLRGRAGGVALVCPSLSAPCCSRLYLEPPQPPTQVLWAALPVLGRSAGTQALPEGQGGLGRGLSSHLVSLPTGTKNGAGG